jgi:hypothetical protein
MQTRRLPELTRPRLTFTVRTVGFESGKVTATTTFLRRVRATWFIKGRRYVRMFPGPGRGGVNPTIWSAPSRGCK